jgi:hypothetical protein
MSDTVIRRAELVDAPALAALRWRCRVEEGDEVPQDEAEFAAGCQAWLRNRIAGSWRVWRAEAGA